MGAGLGSGAGYRVDLDLLEERIEQMAAFERSLERALDRLETTAGQLDETWTGLAAQAHRHAHTRWLREAADMRQALAGLRAAARIAHRNYHAAVAANVSMWEQTR